MAYTDGSYITAKRTKPDQCKEQDTVEQQEDGTTPQADAPRVGASVYIPSPRGTQQTVAILPQEKLQGSFDDTITRAELIAVWQAIDMGCTEILTDSLSVIYELYNVVYRPQHIRLSFHRHAALLQEMRDSIHALHHPIHLYKVKSHIGVVGNERADQIATDVAKGLRLPDIQVTTPSNNREDMFWPHYPQKEDPNGPSPSPKPIEDIGKIATMAHHGHKLGDSNTQAVYYSAAAAIEAAVDPVSHAFLTSTEATFKETTNALKVRTGTFYSQKRAFWYGRAPTDKCLLCGQPDGTLHAVSGCPGLELAVTKRHNDAVTMIGKCVLTGEQGAQLASMDISKERQQDEGLLPTPSRIPAQIFPPAMTQTDRRQLIAKHRPDLVLYERLEHPQRHKYTFVEIKYCRDTQPTDQVARAEQQHAELINTLRRHNEAGNITVELVVLPLGVAGTMYSSVKTDLQDKLGITGPTLNKLMRKLHYHAINALTKIIRYRRIKMGTRTGHAHCSAAAGVQIQPAQARPGKRPILNVRYRPKKRKKR